MQLFINIDVDDLDKAIAFYTEGLGFTMSRKLFGGAVAELTGGAAPIDLLTKAPDSLRHYTRHWTPVHLDFCVVDLDSAVTRVLAAGALQESPLRDNTWGRLATFSDPFGHGFCLMQLAADGYDSVAAPQA